jgi:hypothetical protein
LTQQVYYWDTSAVLSALLQDIHSQEALDLLEREAVHLTSTLTGAEFPPALPGYSGTVN